MRRGSWEGIYTDLRSLKKDIYNDDLRNINGNDFDFYTANDDYTGSIIINNNHEIVAYRNGSTVRVWYNEQDLCYPLHWHNTLEIILPIDNCYFACVNEVTYRIETGEIFMIPPGEPHTVYPPKDGGKRLVYLLDINMIANLKDFAGIQPMLAAPLHIKKDSPFIYKDILAILLRIQYEYFSDTVYNELTIYSLLLNMFVKLGTNYQNDKLRLSTSQSCRQNEYLQKFNDLLAYIDLHYAEPLTLDDMAAKMSFSKFHFSRLFKQYTNYTFCDYLNYRRIKATEELLLSPDLSITDIAMQVGFSSISTFNRVFREHKKCSPSEYRAKLSLIHQK